MQKGTLSKKAVFIFLSVTCFAAGFFFQNLYFHKNIWSKPAEENLKFDGINKIASAPSDTRSRSSPYFEMFYMNRYGIPIKEVHSKMPHLKEDWRQYFPELFQALNFKSLNNSVKSLSLTSRGSMHYVIDVNRTDFEVGDQFNAFIRTVVNQTKINYGGAYFRARLIKDLRKSSFADGIPCQVIDQGNGEYVISAPLAMEGNFYIDIYLVASLDNIEAIIRENKRLKTWRFGFVATTEKGATVTCGMHLDTLFEDKKLCDYSNYRNQESWLCHNPKEENCSRLLQYKFLKSFTRINKPYFFQGSDPKHLVRHFPLKINITVRKSFKPKIEREKQLSSCKKLFETSSSTYNGVTGYYQNREWMSLLCRNKHPQRTQLNRCLGNKIIYFLGDNNIRNTMFFAINSLRLNVKVADSFPYWHKPKLIRSNNNLTMYYRSHGPPVQGTGPPAIEPYISDTISNIQNGGQGVYIMISIGMYLRAYGPNYYLHRLKGIRTAIEDHQFSFPGTKVLIQGLAVKPDDFEWEMRRFDLLLRKVFENMKNVVFVDMWSMTTAHLQPRLKPTKQISRDQAMLMFSYLCSEDSSNDIFQTYE